MAKTPEKKKPIANGTYKSEARLAREAAARKEIKTAALKKIIISSVSFLLAVAVIVTGIVVARNAVLDNGVLMRSRNAMETENFKVTNAMMSYYIYDELYEFAEGKTLSTYGLDIEKSLKKQQYSKAGAQTWFEYFLSIAIDDTETMLYLLEGANKAGFELSAEEIASVKEEAAKLDPKKYGRGIRSADIETAMLYEARAEKYAEVLEESVSVSDEEIKAYIEENKDSFLELSYRYYVVKYDKDDAKEDETTSSGTASAESAASTDSVASVESTASTSSTASDSSSTSSTTSGSTVELVGRDRATAKDLAKQLANCKTEEEFVNKVVELFGEEMTEEEIEELKDGTLKSNVKKSTDSINKWLFDEETEIGETDNIEDESKGTFTVYMKTTEPAVNENKIAAIRRILISTTEAEEDEDESEEETETVDYEKIANDIYDQWKNGEATAESFSAIADEHSDDTSKKGGIYEAIYKGALDDEMDEWIFAEDRKEGDTVLIQGDDGWNILYFDGLGEPQCDYEARKLVYDDKLADLYDALEDDVILFFHYNYMKSIPA